MINRIPAIYENGVFRPLESPGLEENQRVYLLILQEDPIALAASQRQMLADLAGLGKSGRSDIGANHNAFLYPKG